MRQLSLQSVEAGPYSIDLRTPVWSTLKEGRGRAFCSKGSVLCWHIKEEISRRRNQHRKFYGNDSAKNARSLPAKKQDSCTMTHGIYDVSALSSYHILIVGSLSMEADAMMLCVGCTPTASATSV